jgi:hypothetical protein
MMYLWPQAGSMRGMHPRFGVITTAAHGCVPAGIKEGRLWALDNECFRRPFDYERWLAHWHRLFPYSKRCLFVVVPDKPFDAGERWPCGTTGTHKLRKQLDRFDNLAQVRKPWLGLAFAAQDGQESLPLPEEADWVFIAGSTEWKLSDAAASVMQRAWDAGMYIHVGPRQQPAALPPLPPAGGPSGPGHRLLRRDGGPVSSCAGAAPPDRRN